MIRLLQSVINRVKTMFTLVVGTTVEIKLWLGAVMLCTTGIVTTCNPQVGNRIQFTSIDDGDVTALKQSLAHYHRRRSVQQIEASRLARWKISLPSLASIQWIRRSQRHTA